MMFRGMHKFFFSAVFLLALFNTKSVLGKDVKFLSDSGSVLRLIISDTIFFNEKLFQSFNMIIDEADTVFSEFLCMNNTRFSFLRTCGSDSCDLPFLSRSRVKKNDCVCIDLLGFESVFIKSQFEKGAKHNFFSLRYYNKSPLKRVQLLITNKKNEIVGVGVSGNGSHLRLFYFVG